MSRRTRHLIMMREVGQDGAGFAIAGELLDDR